MVFLLVTFVTSEITSLFLACIDEEEHMSRKLTFEIMSKLVLSGTLGAAMFPAPGTKTWITLTQFLAGALIVISWGSMGFADAGDESEYTQFKVGFYKGVWAFMTGGFIVPVVLFCSLAGLVIWAVTKFVDSIGTH